MKNLLNNLNSEEKRRILEQHKGGMNLEIKNFKKLLSNKLGNVQPLMEGAKLSQINVGEVKEQGNQTTPEQNRYIAAGYKEVADINLPNGDYIGNPNGYEQAAQTEKLFSVSDLHIYDKSNKKTGYAIRLNSASRSGVQNANVIITDKKADMEGVYYFKDVEYKPIEQTQTQTITNKVATEGLKNVTSEMMSSPQFKGRYSGYVFRGVFNDVEYSWDCNGVEGMSGVRGMVDGEIISETIENMTGAIGKEITDGKPGSPCVGFYSNEIKFIIYTTNSDKPKCVYF